MRDVTEVNAILENLYDSVLEPVRLAGALESLDRWLGSDLCHLVGTNNGDTSVFLSLITNTTVSNSDMEPVHRAYAGHYHMLDPRRRLARQQPTGRIITCSDYFDERYARRSEFYQDFLRPIGARYVAGACLLRNETQEIYIAFNHMLGRDPFTKEEISHIQWITPHLQRVVKLLTHMGSFRAGLHAGTLGLDALDQGVVVLDRNNSIIFANVRATLLLTQEHVLRSRSNKLEAIRNSKALEDSVSRVRTSRQPESLTIRSMSGFGNEVQNLYLTILGVPFDGHDAKPDSHQLGPTQPSGLSQKERQPSFGAFPNADLIVLISPPRRSATVSAKQLMQLFQLSPAEARLAYALGKGMSMEEYADEACVSMPTVRTQLRSVLKKTGERRLQDLVRMLATLPTALPLL